MRQVDGVLFDLDGVLTDSEPWWNEVRVAFARAHGRAWTHEDQAAVMGGNSAEWASTMRGRLGLEELTEGEIQQAIVDGVVELYRTRPSPVIAGAPEAVRRIAAAHPVALASSSHPAVIAAALDALGLEGVFGAVVSSDEVARGKPAPDVYLRAASLLGVPGDRCLVVEDSLNGVRAGKAAGAFVVLVPNPSVPPAGDARALADLVLERLDLLEPRRLTA
ncbi:MAG TPA: HAD family phosphatase [Candidatus Limnocylindrales bacterium]|nr:HAD family phosphatase [Candidatus Limnocylindrales bacterium]